MTREVKNSTFRYAKVLSTPFFGAGIVELPPGAIKKTKNSAKMHMCFYVVKGRVVAEVQGNRFGLGKGGIWQVPRGEFERESDDLIDGKNNLIGDMQGIHIQYRTSWTGRRFCFSVKGTSRFRKRSRSDIASTSVCLDSDVNDWIFDVLSGSAKH